ncbi:alpha/beta hydrolase [Microcoleus sp. FACHB-831]|uniref:alpha/beta fold hydrolase n=1 Tax=Microcoleus sp. FACHB-831 TaxID=2692827 RepID=UPI001682CB4B|nr:alpha/beta hydrolase [Microcoleus sp. FACHB-831]MBD1922378.1 alpha/beta hydrolase [Microcoleus sp. FACHB-831]
MKHQLIEKQVSLSGFNIPYLEGGIASNSAPLVFLHGWGVGVEPYQESLNILVQRYRVIVPRLLEFEKLIYNDADFNYQKYAQFIIAFLDTLNIKKAHIVGHSIGGGIGIALAASRPDLVRSLLIADSTGFPLGTVPEIVLRRAMEMPAQAWEKPFSYQHFLIPQVFFLNCLVKIRSIINLGKMGIEQDLRPILPKIQVPSLVVWGENDLLTPLKSGKEFFEGIRGAEMLVVEEGYHEWNLFFADKFAAIISEFIEKIEHRQEQVSYERSPQPI